MGRSSKVQKHSSLPLDSRLAAIGAMVSSQDISKKEIDATDIEETLADFVLELSKDDSLLRLMNPVLSWIAAHGSAVIIEKLIKMISHHQKTGGDILYVSVLAIVALSNGHKRWSTVLKKYALKKPQLFLPSPLTKSLLSLRGKDPLFKECGFLVPKGMIEINSKWTLPRTALAQISLQYRNRLIYGAQWRADIITAYELGARTPTEASRMTGASYEPCHRFLGEIRAAGIKFSA